MDRADDERLMLALHNWTAARRVCWCQQQDLSPAPPLQMSRIIFIIMQTPTLQPVLSCCMQCWCQHHSTPSKPQGAPWITNPPCNDLGAFDCLHRPRSDTLSLLPSTCSTHSFCLCSPPASPCMLARTSRALQRKNIIAAMQDQPLRWAYMSGPSGCSNAVKPFPAVLEWQRSSLTLRQQLSPRGLGTWASDRLSARSAAPGAQPLPVSREPLHSICPAPCLAPTRLPFRHAASYVQVAPQSGSSSSRSGRCHLCPPTSPQAAPLSYRCSPAASGCCSRCQYSGSRRSG